jgi:hypothetical protein
MIKGWGETHPLTAAMALDYAGALQTAGHHDEAETVLQRVRPIIETTVAATSSMRKQLDSLLKSPVGNNLATSPVATVVVR